mmetsp:Transcript_142115/g.250635  ORF Transcript_142115/g.250635 Transcript_142115/m.250635 type:complete len:105 (-) Transcript_142115:22-336(-)
MPAELRAVCSRAGSARFCPGERLQRPMQFGAAALAGLRSWVTKWDIERSDEWGRQYGIKRLSTSEWCHQAPKEVPIATKFSTDVRCVIGHFYVEHCSSKRIADR